MVMHARKYQRLNDGYYERGQGHSYEEKPPSKSRSSKYCETKDSPGNGNNSRNREEDASPARPSPRYHSKSSYSDREKDRMSRVSSDSPGEKRTNHRASSSKNGKGRDHHRSSTSGGDLKEIQKSALQVCGDWSEHRSHSGKKYYYNCKTEVSQWEPPKDWVDASPKSEISRKDSREKSGSKAYVEVGSYRGHKHSSSSQMQDNSKYSSSSSSIRGSSHPVQYSTTPDSKLSRQYSIPSSSTSTHKSWSATPGNNDPHHRGDHAGASTPATVTRTSTTPAYSRCHSSSAAIGGASSSSSRLSPERSGYDFKHSKQTPTSSRNSNTLTNSSHRGDHRNNSSSSAYMLQSLSRSALHDQDGRDGATGEDMDISPGSTPTEESMSERLQRDHHPTNTSSSHHNAGSLLSSAAASSQQLAAAVAASVASGSHNSGGGGVTTAAGLLSQLSGSDGAGFQKLSPATITHQAIATLQKLQEALSAHQRQKQQQLAQLLQQQQQQQQSGNNTSTPPVSSNNTATSNLINASSSSISSNQPQHNGSQSPESDGTPLQSPEPNMTSSLQSGGHLSHQNILENNEHNTSSPSTNNTNTVTVSTASLLGASPGGLNNQSGSQLASAAVAKKPDSIELPPSLANYYDESLIGHVSSWMEEGRSLERAADRFAEEAHNIGALGSTQVSADLKKARSCVRLYEIQSTVQEQRILFVRQQTKEFEGMRSQNTFMPGAT